MYTNDKRSCLAVFVQGICREKKLNGKKTWHMKISWSCAWLYCNRFASKLSPLTSPNSTDFETNFFVKNGKKSFPYSFFVSYSQIVFPWCISMILLTLQGIYNSRGTTSRTRGITACNIMLKCLAEDMCNFPLDQKIQPITDPYPYEWQILSEL